MQKILFLDIDGVLIPRRCYGMPNQTRPLVTKFDPGVVGMLNQLAREKGYKFVIHSSWLRTALLTSYGITDVKSHMVNEGLKEEYFHEDHSCYYRLSGTRWTAITDWLLDHDKVHYWVIEDEPMPYEGNDVLFKRRVIQTDFDEGLTYRQFAQIFYEGEYNAWDNENV